VTDLDELTKTISKLETLDTHRKQLIQYRDRQIREALAGGTTWVRLQELTGLSVRGLQLATKRGTDD
jgi:site-specific recombinase XerC